MKYKKFVKTAKSLTIVCEDKGKPVVKTFPASSTAYAEGSILIRKKKFADLVNLVKKKTVVKKKTTKSGKVTHTYKGKKIPASLSTVIDDTVDNMMDLSPIENFLRRLAKNPSTNSKNQLETWIKAQGITLLPDGRFVLYKGVTTNSEGQFVSIHDKKTLHEIGKPVFLDRKLCDDNPSTDCGRGLHVTTSAKVDSWYSGYPKLEIIVDPEHVVSVPDCGTKIRCCEYFVARKMGDNDQPQEGLIACESGRSSDVPIKSEVIPIKGEKVTLPSRLVALSGLKGECYIHWHSVNNPYAEINNKDESDKPTRVLEEGTIRIRIGGIKELIKAKNEIQVDVFSRRIVIRKVDKKGKKK